MTFDVFAIGLLVVMLASPLLALSSYLVARAVTSAYFRSKQQFLKEVGNAEEV